MQGKTCKEINVGDTAKFSKTVFIRDTITAIVEVTQKDEAKNRVYLRTYCDNQGRNRD